MIRGTAKSYIILFLLRVGSLKMLLALKKQYFQKNIRQDKNTTVTSFKNIDKENIVV